VGLVGKILVSGLLSLVLIKAAQAGPPPTCTINLPQNDPVSVTTGGSELFQGTVSGGTAPYTVTFTFEGGGAGGSTRTENEVLNNSGDQTQQYNVTYDTAGGYTATLSATDSDSKRAKTCSATRTVNVSSGGGGNSRPVAQNDDYNTQQETHLSITAPGVLGNDNDPDGDPMTANLVAGPSHAASFTLNSNGSFNYTPASDYHGGDSFTYTANDAGGPSNIATVTIGVTASGAVSINSTSAQGALSASPVGEIPFIKDPNYAIVAINDLGMHCGDLDTRISSILPPFNVLHSQVILRGNGGLPQVLGEGQVDITYSAVSNPDDPAPARVASGLALSSVTGNGDVYKTNFWDIALQAYDPFYPSGILPLFSTNVDVGLPMPDVERFYLEDGYLSASQQAMPGIASPYAANDPQPFHEHIGTQPFFINFPFGYTADVNLYEAAGVPVAAFDDAGQENPYPLVRVQAEVSNNPVATVDIVMPISGEAECQACHAAPADGGNGTATVDAGLVSIQASIDDPLEGADVPLSASVEWASDINILRLHDLKHGTTLESAYDPATGRADDPVVCQRCHYTPALDLAQLGPLGPENDTSLVLNGGTLPIASLANGRDQVKHKSMSNVMHSHHASTGLFPDMPPAINGQGERRDPITTQTILEETCYRCHPGKRTACMRGAMANGGLVCQDCHGQMVQVGDDFSRNVSPANPGAFELGADFYSNPATPRVPWANEPSCGSCHTGYATDNLAGDANVLVNPTDTLGNSDGIRLLAAYRTNDAKATAIVPTSKAFAENVVAEGTAADGNPKLYRVSTGHGGLFCEACHGSTHAEWPVANPTANENVPSTQIQGHRGYIAQCQVCHEPNDASLPLGNNGPHGMHPIADLEPNLGVNGVDNGTSFQPDDRWNLQHRSYRNQGPGCESCHGDDLRGTVLSRTADERTVRCKDNKGSLPGCAAGNPTAIIPKGTPVGCGLCHRQK
jgi:hypothetical protein